MTTTLGVLDLKEAATKAAGNWQRFSCFVWYRDGIDDKDGVEPLRRGKVGDKVHGYGSPGAVRYGKGLEQAVGGVARGLGAGAGVAGLDVLGDEPVLTRPTCEAADKAEGLGHTKVTSGRGVVTLLDQAEVVSSG